MARTLSLLALTIATFTLLPGCRTLYSYYNRPLIEKNIEQNTRTRVIGLQADRRLVIFHKRPGRDDETQGGSQGHPNAAGTTARASGDPDDRLMSFIIAEPSPDAFTEFAAAFQAALQASGTIEGQVADGSISAEIFDRFTTNMVQLGARTQGVTVFRDGTYRLAEAYMNGRISDQQYVELYQQLLSTTERLVLLEIKLNPDMVSDVAEPDSEWRDLVMDAARLQIYGEIPEDDPADDEDTDTDEADEDNESDNNAEGEEEEEEEESDENEDEADDPATPR